MSADDTRSTAVSKGSEKTENKEERKEESNDLGEFKSAGPAEKKAAKRAEIRSRADTVPRSTAFRIISVEVTDAFIKQTPCLSPTSVTEQSNNADDVSDHMSGEHTTDDSKVVTHSSDERATMERVNDALITAEEEPTTLASPSGDVYYKIVVNGMDPGWILHKRYSQFEALNQSLLNNPTYQKKRVKLPPLPIKQYKWWVDHTGRDFLEKRRALLDNYCVRLIKHKVVGQSQEVFNFFSSDKQSQESTDSFNHHSSAVPVLSGKSQSTSSLFTTVASKRRLSTVLALPASSSSTSSLLTAPISRRGTVAVTVTSKKQGSAAMGSDVSSSVESGRIPAPYSSGDPVTSAPDSSYADGERVLREVTGITIPKTRLMPDHVLYQVRMENEDRYQDGMESSMTADEREEKSSKLQSSGPDQFKVWTLMKRFSNFYELNDQLLNPEFLTQIGLNAQLIRNDVSKGKGELFPILPPRRSKYWCDHKDREFVETRRVLLENYMQRLLSMPEIVSSSVFLKFIGVDLGE